MFYECVRLIVLPVAVRWDPIHKSQEVLPIWAYKMQLLTMNN